MRVWACLVLLVVVGATCNGFAQGPEAVASNRSPMPAHMGDIFSRF